MTPRSIIAVVYVVAAACVAVINGPGPDALADEIAMFAVFEQPKPHMQEEPRRIAWELDDLPAYLTEEAIEPGAAHTGPLTFPGKLAGAPVDLAPGAALH